MSQTSTPLNHSFDDLLEYPAEAETILENEENMTFSTPKPKASTLRLLKQFARCYVSTSGIAIPALSAMIAN
ncbi:MAG: hypothetical protein HUK13_09605 [Muribaculaceae bacterium]|nr:hypothetical protein [Muribaculaceae bacterium]MCF0214666.1 hypothetical protein [Muribaculaceae bacterium]